MDGKNWEENQDGLKKSFTFTDFAGALKVGNLAEKAHHHPDVSFGWGYAKVTLFTHSEQKITDKDRELAKQIDLL